MRRFLLPILLALLLLPMAAGAELFMLPDGISVVESGAFGSIPSITEVYVPSGVTRIADDAFDASLTTVYGTAGTEAEAFALRSGRRFFDCEITNVSFSVPPIVGPGETAVLTANAACGLPLEYRFVLTRGKTLLADSGYTPSPQYRYNSKKYGTVDVTLYIRNAALETAVSYPAVFNVSEKFLNISSLPIRVNMGQTVLLYGTGDYEYRQTELSSDVDGLLGIGPNRVKGTKEGKGMLTLRVGNPSYTLQLPFEVVRAVTDIEVSPLPAYVFEGDEYTLEARALPQNATYPAVSFSSSDPSVAEIDANGHVRALKNGDTLLTLRADTYTLEIPLHVYRAAEAISIAEAEAPLYTRGSIALTPVFEPESADDRRLVWTVDDESIASVDENGVVTGLSCGEVTVYAAPENGKCAAAQTVLTVLQGTDSISLTADDTEIYPGEELKVSAQILPADTVDKTVFWEVLTPEFASVTEDGTVSPGSRGEAVLRATAVNGVTAEMTLQIYDSFLPDSLEIVCDSAYVEIGATLPLSVRPLPCRADSSVLWSSGSPEIAVVDENGVVTGVSYGMASIQAVSALDGKVKTSLSVVVLSDERCLVIPQRTTDIGGIGENLDKINNVQQSAFAQLDLLAARGKISASVCAARKAAISRMFDLYSFPWITEEFQPYWKEENSEGGIKHFRPGQVYYGMPYISGTYASQRLYNPAKAISEERWITAEDGPYYILNQSRLIGGKYAGTDCSSSAAIAFYGISGQIGTKNTAWFASTNEFVSLPKTDELYPGDILVKGYGHMVMFLYYASEDKSQIMLIQQGGSEVYTNTVSCGIYRLSTYLNGGYTARRYASWR